MNTQIKDKTLRRLAIAEGHLKKVRSMIEDNEYCPDIIHQSKAVQSALKKIDQIILQNHLHECVLGDTDIKQSKKERLVSEIIDLFKKDGK